MKKIFLRTAAVVLSSLMTLSCIPASALYRGVLGDVYYIESKQIGAGVDYTEYRSVTDGLNERAYVFEYRPGEGSLPIVTHGESLAGSTRVNSLAQYESKKGYNVLGGTNGDFYSVYTGVPLGCAVRDGRLLTDDDKNSAVGFTYDGDTIFGNPDITFTVVHTYEKKKDNVSSQADGTSPQQSGADAEAENQIKQESSGELSDGSNMQSDANSFQDEITSDSSKNKASENSEENETLIDSEKESSDDGESSESVPTDTEIINEVLPVSYFNKFPTEWGAYLLDDVFSSSTHSSKNSLEIVIELDNPDSFAKIGSSLTGTVVGVYESTQDTPIAHGQLVISVCETSTYRTFYGNVSTGSRISVTFSAADGWENVQTAIGGSDVFIKDGAVDMSVIDEAYEKIANPRTAVGVRADGTVILFAADGRQDISYGFRLVSLAETMISFGCVYAMNLDGGGSTTAVVRFPGESSSVVVNSPSDGAERYVSNAILLVDTSVSDNVPRYIIPSDASPFILKGESITFDDAKICDSSLAEVSYDNDSESDPFIENMRISFDKSRLSYYSGSSLPDLGTISDDGKTYTANGITGEIPLLLTSEYNGNIVTGRAIVFVTDSPDEIIVSLDEAVYTGTDSLAIEFESYYMKKKIPSYPSHAEFSLTDEVVNTAHTPLSGETDNSRVLSSCSIGYVNGDAVFVPYEDADGSAILTVLLDGIPVFETRIITGSGIIPVGEKNDIKYDFSSDNGKSITIPLDFSLTAAQSIDIYASYADIAFFAQAVTSNGDVSKIYFQLQNEPDSNGVYHYRAALDGKYVSLKSLMNIDAEENHGKNGNLHVSTINVSYSDTETVFRDTLNHWAKKNINALYRMGIVGGESTESGPVFSPERSLSRAEFAVMMSRTLRYNPDDYSFEENAEFDDSADIPSWALPYVKTVSANGLMNGKRMPDGTLCFDPNGKITRQEIMQVIGNLIKSLSEDTKQADTETSSENTDSGLDAPQTGISDILQENTEECNDTRHDIADINDVADWAYDNVILTLDAGIINGYDDKTIKPLNNVTRAEAATIILRTAMFAENFQ